jgi:hypothetical protein
LDRLLAASGLFEKEEVDFKVYAQRKRPVNPVPLIPRGPDNSRPVRRSTATNFLAGVHPAWRRNGT